MSQVQLKQIISSLCNIFEAFNFSKISAEDFRQAKFNKPDVVGEFSSLLNKSMFKNGPSNFSNRLKSFGDCCSN